MRIALIAPDIPEYCVAFAEVAAHSADVLLCASASRFKDLPGRQRFHVELLPWPRQRNILASGPFVKELARRIQNWRPDIVHLLVEDHIWMLLLKHLLRDIPIVTTVHDVRPHLGDVGSWLRHRCFVGLMRRQSDALLVHGDHLAEQLKAVLPNYSKPVAVFPHVPLNGYYSIAKEHKLERTDRSTFNILFYGRICKYKGLEFLLEAMPTIRCKIPQVRLTIAGRGSTKSLISAMSHNYITVLNRHIPIIEGARLFTESDVVVLPYIEASQSGVLMIAMSFGLPVVVTNVGEMPHTVRSTDTGLVIPSGDSSAIADAVVAVALDHEMRNGFCKNAQKAINGVYSIRHLASTLALTYDLLLQQMGRKPH